MESSESTQASHLEMDCHDDQGWNLLDRDLETCWFVKGISINPFHSTVPHGADFDDGCAHGPQSVANFISHISSSLDKPEGSVWTREYEETREWNNGRYQSSYDNDIMIGLSEPFYIIINHIYLLFQLERHKFTMNILNILAVTS